MFENAIIEEKEFTRETNPKIVSQNTQNSTFGNAMVMETEYIRKGSNANVVLQNFTQAEIMGICSNAKGNPYGTFEEKINFIQWLVDTPYIRNGASFMKIAIDNFDKGITTEFLKNMGKSKNTRRIRDLRARIGVETAQLNHYHKEFVLAQSKTILHDYGMKDGKVIEYVPKVESTGNFTRRNVKKILNKWITQDEYRMLTESLERLEKRANEEYGMKHYQKEIALNNLCMLEEGKEGKEIKRNLTEREFTAIYKIQNKDKKFFMTNCEHCKGIMKFPLSPNIDTDRNEQIANELYQMYINRCGVVLCNKCEENIWNEDEIKESINDMRKAWGHEYKFEYEESLSEFCQTFRKDKKVKDKELVQREIGKMLEGQAKLKVNDDLMIIRLQ